MRCAVAKLFCKLRGAQAEDDLTRRILRTADTQEDLLALHVHMCLLYARACCICAEWSLMAAMLTQHVWQGMEYLHSKKIVHFDLKVRRRLDAMVPACA